MSALPRSIRSILPLAGAIAVLVSASYAAAATPPGAAASGMPQTHTNVTEPSLLLDATPVKQLAPLFPITGLIAAVWATHHVRRRNVRRLATTR